MVSLCSNGFFSRYKFTKFIKIFHFLKKIESVAYEFGSNKGMIQYTYPAGKQPDTEEDSIALGFMTTKADAVLLRVESTTTQDYMELEIVK